MTAYPVGLSFHEAEDVVAQVAASHRLESEVLALARCHGRVLAQDLVAPIGLQPFDNSAMDGYAVRHRDVQAEGGTRLRLVGEQFAGRPQDLCVQAGQCVRITTGAPLPAGADAVVVKEKAVIEDDMVLVPAGTAPGANIRRAGEDVQAGEVVLRQGDVLGSVQIALAAALGVAQLQVSRRPTVAVFTTGDELVDPGLPLGPGQIHDSNRDLLMGLLRADGLEPTAWPRLPDDPRRIEVALRDAGCAFDLILTCGGVSAGEHDHLPQVIDQFGTIHFWKVRMKPGMPLLFGSLDQARVLGLPGNPVSVLATWLTLGRRLVDGLQGRAVPRSGWRARLAAPVDKRHDRREFMRARLESGADGSLLARPDPATGSHRLRAAAEANALIVLPEGPQALAAGDVVEAWPYP